MKHTSTKAHPLTSEDAIASLRALLSQQPSSAAFGEVLSFLAGVDGGSRAVVIEYAKEHLQMWPLWAYVDTPQLGLVDELADLMTSAPITLDDCLTRCHAALVEEQSGSALEWALSAWRLHPHPALAVLVEEIDAALPPLRLEGKTKAVEQQWLQAEETRDPRLLRGLWETIDDTRSLGIFGQRLTRLAAWRHDPRTVTAALRLLRAVPWTSNSSQKWWRMLLDMLIGCPDVRLRELRACADEWNFRDVMVEYLTRYLDKTIAKLDIPEPTPLSAEEEVLLGSLQAVLSSQDPSKRPVALGWAALCSAPDDEDVRAALVDALVATEDPRGRWMSLQRQKRRSKEENAEARALLDTYRDEWLGPAGKVMAKGETYKAGFLHKVKLKKRAAASLIEASDDPTWATVEAIAGYWEDASGILGLAHLYSLSQLELKASETLPDEDITGFLNALEAATVASHLRELAISLSWMQANFSQMIASLFHRLRADAFPVLESFSLDCGRSRWTYTFGPAGGELVLQHRYAPDSAAFALWALPEDAVAVVTSDVTPASILQALSAQHQLQSVNGESPPALLPERYVALRAPLRGIRGRRQLDRHWYGSWSELTTQRRQHGLWDLMRGYAHFHGVWLEPLNMPLAACSPDGRHMAYYYFYQLNVLLHTEGQDEPSHIELPNEHVCRGMFFEGDRLWLEYQREKGDPLGFLAYSLSEGTLTDEILTTSVPLSQMQRIAVQASVDGDRVFLYADGNLLCLSLSTKSCEILFSHTSSRPRSLLLSPSERWLLVGDAKFGDGDIDLWDVSQGIHVGCFSEATRGLSSVCFTPDEESFFTLQGSTLYRCFVDDLRREPWFAFDHQDFVYALPSPDGEHLALIEGSSGTLLFDWAAQLPWFRL